MGSSNRILAVVGLSLLVLAVLYVGAYYWMVFPGFAGEANYWVETKTSGARVYRPSEGWNRFFLPIHFIDRHARLDIWEE